MTADYIDKILKQEDSLKLHFSLATSTEHCYAARLLNEMYIDKTNILCMHFLHPILQEIKVVNNFFQLETGDSSGVFSDLEWLFMSKLRQIIKPCMLRMNTDQQLREPDLKSPNIFISRLDADLGTSFSMKLEASSLLLKKKQMITTCCMEFLNGAVPGAITSLLGDTEETGAVLSKLCDVHHQQAKAPGFADGVFLMPT